MRIIETKIYTYDELSDEAKEKARNWYREGGPDYKWWDATYEDAKQCAAILGIGIENIWFSGFASQGDGACFEGEYQYAKGAAKAIADYAPQDTELLRIAKELQTIQKLNFYQLRAKTVQHGRHYHAHCMDVEVYRYDEKAIVDAEASIKELMRDFAGWIYSQLEKEYNWLNSNEQVEETIIANDYEFTEDGERA